MKIKTIILLIMALTACNGFQQTTDKPQLADVQTGTQGLDINFDITSKNIYMCQQTSILTTLKNLGTHRIEKGKISVNYDSSAVKPIAMPKLDLELGGKTQYNPDGEMEKIGFTLESKTLPSNLKSHTTPFILTACYPYQTKANFPACIDPDVLNTQLAKPCTPQDIITSGGQGAPVAITKIEQKMLLQNKEVRPIFLIHIANQGNGRVIQQEVIEDACGKGVKAQVPEVKIKAFLGKEELNCKRNNISLVSEDPYVMCESKKTYPQGGVTFGSVITVQLDYGYVMRKSTEIIITRLQGQENCEARSAGNPQGTPPLAR